METNTANTYSYSYNNYCKHRLPCGYCKLLEKTCPMMFYCNQPNIVYCNTSANTTNTAQ